MDSNQRSSLESLVIVFAHALAGLGHLRVINALHEGLIPEADVILLGSHDKAIQNIHRVTTAHPIGKIIADWIQAGPLSNLFAVYYKQFLRSHTRLLYEQLTTIMEQRIKEPKKLLVVATHFGLAHQLAAIKEKIEKEKKVKIYLVVQVTDATFHPMWYVEGADLIVSPDHASKEKLIDYGKKTKHQTRIEILPYPVNPKYSLELLPNELADKEEQLQMDGTNKIHVSVPVSGAAVGTGFHTEIIKVLNDCCLQKKGINRFIFWVVSRNNSYTEKFLKGISQISNVKIFSSESERNVVEDYDNLFQKTIISLEITKPSEQAFKALVPPKCMGAPILLLTKPIGKQEEDNVVFLQNHYLIPNNEEMDTLWRLAHLGEKISDELSQKAKGWRGINLPGDPKTAGKFMYWCYENKLFEQMNKFTRDPKILDEYESELAPNGVTKFWDLVTEFINKN